MHILTYTLIVLMLWLIIVNKFFFKNLYNHLVLTLTGFIVAFTTENILIYLGFLKHNTYPQILGIPLIILLLYFFYFSFVYKFSKYYFEKYKRDLYLTIFIISTFFGFLFEITGTVLGYWSYSIGPKILEFNILSPIAVGIMLVGIFYITNLIKKIF